MPKGWQQKNELVCYAVEVLTMVMTTCILASFYSRERDDQRCGDAFELQGRRRVTLHMRMHNVCARAYRGAEGLRIERLGRAIWRGL